MLQHLSGKRNRKVSARSHAEREGSLSWQAVVSTLVATGYVLVERRTRFVGGSDLDLHKEGAVRTALFRAVDCSETKRVVHQFQFPIREGSQRPSPVRHSSRTGMPGGKGWEKGTAGRERGRWALPAVESTFFQLSSPPRTSSTSFRFKYVRSTYCSQAREITSFP